MDKVEVSKIKTSNVEGKERRRKKREKVLSELRKAPMAQVALPTSRFTGQEYGLSDMRIPQGDLDRIRSFLGDNSSNKLVLDYLGCLINPKACMVRVPDSFARPTALVRSIVTYDVTTRIDSSANSGRFSVAVNPILGDPDGTDPALWKIAQVASGQTWPVDFSNPASFLQETGGEDLRVDPFFAPLTQNPPGLLVVTANTPGSIQPFSTGTSSVTVNTNSYGIGFSINTVAPGQWFLPPGQYLITVQANSTSNPITATAKVPGNLIAVPGAFNSSANPSLVVFFNVQNVGEWFAITLNSNAASVVNVAISNTQSALGGAPMDFGSVSQIRPVAMSALASYIGTTLQDGGNIAAAYVPGDTLNANYFVNSGSITQNGCFEFWESLSKQPTAYNGPLRDGAYTWWSPEDYEDLQMFRPSGSTTGHHYPSLIISGQFLPGLTGTVDVPVIRLEVVTVYEFSTNSLLYETQSCVGSQAIMDSASSALFGQPHSMANAIHLKWLGDMAKKILGGIGAGSRYISKNKSKILPILGGLGSLL